MLNLQMQAQEPRATSYIITTRQSGTSVSKTGICPLGWGIQCVYDPVNDARDKGCVVWMPQTIHHKL